MRIIVTPVKAKDLEPGDLFTTGNQQYWDAVSLPKHETGLPVGERVFIRTPTPCPPEQAECLIYKLQIEKED